MRVLFDITWGYLPDAVSMLHPALLKTFGTRFLESAYENLRPTLAVSYPIIEATRHHGKVIVVTVRLWSRIHLPRLARFLYLKVAGRWVEAYASLLRRGTALAAESQAQSLSHPLSLAALRRGILAETRYQQAAARLLSHQGVFIAPYA